MGARKKSCTKSINNRLPAGKAGVRTIENSRMESSKHNHTCRQSQMFGDTMISDNISDITYRSKSCLRRGCCQERDKIAKKLESKNKKRASQVRKSSIIEARGGSGNGLGGGGQGRNSSAFAAGPRCQTHMAMMTSEMPSIMQSQVKNSSNYSYNTRKALGKNGDKSTRLNNRKILENAQKRKKEGRGDECQSTKAGGFFLERSRSHNNIGEHMEPPVHQPLEVSQDQNLININTNTSGSMATMAPPTSNTQAYYRDRIFNPQELHSHASNQQNHGSTLHQENGHFNVYNSLRNVSASSSNRLLQGAQRQQANARYR